MDIRLKAHRQFLCWSEVCICKSTVFYSAEQCCIDD